MILAPPISLVVMATSVSLFYGVAGGGRGEIGKGGGELGACA